MKIISIAGEKMLKYGVYAKAVELLCFKPALNNNGTFSIEISK